ncbi:sarcosine oxidase [Roseimicrobium gellanilyticum]|uniref:Sarcosine oxidase n=1 Tax=Roseimicrobium gellanilyticum TaxID=748857 RepID=A0A366H856_9BACT|nr:N-methyl-L-tryptophan oxidase [Roseimicrobium gellanilyticum]RBP37746.1 sarcosine oxidase [Roseimicrobium gellanilyticum]
MKSYDVIVAGVGAMGSATLYHLAKQGLRVAGIDPHPPGHAFGSSHGETRIIRKAYFLDGNYLPLLERSYELWRELEAESGKELMKICGLLCIGESESEFIAKLEEASWEAGLALDCITAAEARELHPAMQVPEDLVIYHDRDGGYLSPENCVSTHAERACAHGAALFAGEPLLEWSADGDGVRVRTANRTLTASKLILTTGAWAMPEFAKLGIPLRVRRKVMFWHRISEPERFRSTPVWIWARQDHAFYGFPTLDGATMKSAEDSGGEYLEHPDARDFSIRRDDDEALTPFLHTAFPALVHEVDRAKTCLYTDAEDRNFIVAFHPEHPQVLLASCCSGHGFKLSSAMGEVLARTVQNGMLPPEATFFGMRYWRSM